MLLADELRAAAGTQRSSIRRFSWSWNTTMNQQFSNRVYQQQY
jgi:hypothetical protein